MGSPKQWRGGGQVGKRARREGGDSGGAVEQPPQSQTLGPRPREQRAA